MKKKKIETQVENIKNGLLKLGLGHICVCVVVCVCIIKGIYPYH